MFKNDFVKYSRVMKKANNAAGLKRYQFKPGKSGNPKGRPKALPGINKMLTEVITEDARRSILKMLVAQAKKGNMRAIELVLDRLYGRVQQQTEVSGKMDVRSIQMLIQRDDEKKTT